MIIAVLKKFRFRWYCKYILGISECSRLEAVFVMFVGRDSRVSIESI